MTDTLAPTTRRGPAGLWDTYVASVKTASDKRSRTLIAEDDPSSGDRVAVTILLTATLCLVGIEYLGATGQPQWLLSTLRAVGLDAVADRFSTAMFDEPHGEFWRLTFWSGVRVVLYIAVPLAVLRALGVGRRHVGLTTEGVRAHGRPYLLLFAVAAPFITLASFGSAFQAKYPFYDPIPGDGLWPYVVGWWLVYGVQFVGVEVFFRGVLVLGLEARLGFLSVFVSTVPYVMIHFGKPLAETVGAALTGIALGTLVLKNRSIWWGAALHIAAAILLDVLALTHEGFF